MKADNLNYLQNQLRFTGFGEALFGSLEEKILQGEEGFQLQATLDTMEEGVLEATLYFGKSKSDEFYFFNRYIATLIVGNERRSHSFQIRQRQNLNITFTQAGHLLAGRPVYTEYAGKDESVSQKVWMELDLGRKESEDRFRVNRYFPKYGYDLEEALEKYGLKAQIRQDQLSVVIGQLQRGYKPKVILKKGEASRAVWLVAQPRFRSFSMFDLDGHLIYLAKVRDPKEKIEVLV